MGIKGEGRNGETTISFHSRTAHVLVSSLTPVFLSNYTSNPWVTPVGSTFKVISRTWQLITTFLATCLQKITIIFLTSLFLPPLYSNGLFFRKEVRLIILNMNQIVSLLCFKPCNDSHLAQSKSRSPDNGLKTQHVLFPNHVISDLASATLPPLTPLQVRWPPFCSSIAPETSLTPRFVLTVLSTWISLPCFSHLLFFYRLSTASRNICPDRAYIVLSQLPSI